MMSESKREKIARPFYELPAHIKPCSRIIQETRMQLRYGGKLPPLVNSSGGVMTSGSPGGEWSTSSQFGHGDNDPATMMMMMEGGSKFAGDGFNSNNHSYDEGSMYSDHSIGPPSASYTGIRAIHTQRPKTGTDHDMSMFWGLSSRKRPPSAITLSRLSIDEIDEKRPTLKPVLGSLDKKQVTSSSLDYSEDSSSSSASSLNRDVEKTRLKIKSMSVSSLGRSKNEDGRLVEEPLDEREGRWTTTTTTMETGGGGGGVEKQGKRRPPFQSANNNISSSSNSRQSDDSQMRNNVVAVNSTSRVSSCHETVSGENEEIDGLLPAAVNYLNSLVNPVNSERPLKSEFITALQRVKSCIDQVEESPELKHRLLKLIFKIVERNQNDEDVVFWASFVLLHCKIIGNNLTTVFKMVFKASRSKDYWGIIQETEYLDVFMESFGQTCPITQTECMIYGYGTLKFICVEKPVLTRIIQLNLISIMTLHLKLLNYEVAKLKKVPENIFNGAFQLTSILRSVVGEESSLNTVVSSGLLEELCNSLVWSVDDIDVLSNLVRILSVVSGDNICCKAVSANAIFTKSIVKILQMWHMKDDVVVRLAYCLGNLLATCENMRVKMYEEPACYEMILYLINYYMERFSPISEDILIKVFTILANWSLNSTIGSEICDDPQLCEILNRILNTTDISDELLICVISTLNNTTFYKNYTASDDTTVQTAEYLYEYLTIKNLEARTEVMKVLGNLTRNSVIRKAAAEHVGEILVSLEEDNESLQCATVGVLMNIIINPKACVEFFQRRGIDLLLRLMQEKNDVGLNLMICQFIWNVQISCEKNAVVVTADEDDDDEEELEQENANPQISVDSSSLSPVNIISTEKRVEVQNLLRRKLDSISQMTQSDEFPFLDLIHEFQSLAERLYDKLGENE